MKILNMVLMMAALAAPAAAQQPAGGTEAWKTRTFTAEELKKYNGKDGMPVYAAVDGIVYDLSKSKYWKTGTHMKMHQGGTELSEDIHKKAPQSIHRDGKILERMPKVGVLASGGTAASEKPAVAVHKVLKEELGKEYSCPVTKARVKVTEKTPALDFKGKTYFFSGETAMEKFKASPGKYLGELKDGKEKVKSLAKKKS
jgi:predicted heme/steroid binding protein/YHS domain-containing protein